jgi:3-polyprenyl-4-hydroxybenzoate decarboxylase
MQNLEAQLHTLLEEIAPEAHNYDETAKIIATASAIINKKYNSRKLTKTSSRQVEAFLTDALLQSMSVLETWEDDFSYGYVDGRGLSASQLINRVATTAKSNWGNMNLMKMKKAFLKLHLKMQNKLLMYLKLLEEEPIRLIH